MAAGGEPASAQGPAKRLAKGGAYIALCWSVLAIVIGLLVVPLVALAASDHGTYCESGDHPGDCPEVVPALVYAAAAMAGGAWSIPTSVRFHRRRRGARRALLVTLTTWAAAQLMLGAWAAVEDDSSRLSAPGRALLTWAIVHAAVCSFIAALVTLTPVPQRDST